jgi:hypothetical protein
MGVRGCGLRVALSLAWCPKRTIVPSESGHSFSRKPGSGLNETKWSPHGAGRLNRLLGVDRKKYAPSRTMEFVVCRTSGCDASPPGLKQLPFLNRCAFKEVDELRSAVDVQGKRGTRSKTDQLHGATICSAQVLDLHT